MTTTQQKYRLISVKDLSSILKVTSSWVHEQIKNNVIKDDIVFKLPPQSKNSPLRIDYIGLINEYPDIEYICNNPDSILKVEELVNILSISNTKNIYKQIKRGVYPVFDLPRNLIRINKDELLCKFPDLVVFF